VAQPTDLETRIRVLEDIEAIKKMKSKYLRCNDKKLWDEIGVCFTEDAVADYGPKTKLQGREAIVQYLKGSLGQDSVIRVHQG
jgi:hypothetical protein